MNFKIKQKELMHHLNYAIRGISTKNLIPILNCIKFELDKDGLTLLSTDNEFTIKSFISKKHIEEIGELGSFVVSGRYIYDIVRKLPNEIIEIEEVLDAKIIITTPNSSFKLNCNQVSDFPEIEIESTKNPIKISQQILKNIINETIFATSNQESRPVLTGMNFKIRKNSLEVTATDSYRLASKSIILDNNFEEEINIIISAKNLNEINKLIEDSEENIEIHIFNNKIIFHLENLTIISRLINGAYPDTNKLIPTSFTTNIIVNLDDLYAAIDRASLLTNELDKNTIKLEVDNKNIVISSTIPEIGHVTETVEIKKHTGENIKIAFSSKFMMDAIKSFQTETVELMFNGEVKPIIVKSDSESNLTQLILPIRTY